MEVLSCIRIDFIVLVMYFMHFVQIFKAVKESMGPIEKKILGKIHNQYLAE